MVTLFSVPKRFEGHVGVIQRNAVQSWSRLPEVEIVLCGAEAGVAEAASEVGARHLPDVPVNEYGTPLLDSIFNEVRALSTEPLMAYVNGDIILLADFVEAVRRVKLRSFLMVGRRSTIDVVEPIDFGRADWEEAIRVRRAKKGKLDPPMSIDYFVFDREGPPGDLPAFAVGRPRWDNWMIYNARRRRVPVIDATPVITAIHQRHHYDHVPVKRREPWFGPEADANEELAGGIPTFRIFHATHVLTPLGLWPAITPIYLRARWPTRHLVGGRVERVWRLLEPPIVATRGLRRRLRSAAARMQRLVRLGAARAD